MSLKKTSTFSLTTPYEMLEEGDSEVSGFLWRPLEWHWWIILQLVSAILGIVGNLLVILVLHQRRAASRSTDILVRSLAAADLMASVFLIPVPPHDTVPLSRLGYIYCLFVGNNTLMWICFTASTYNLVAISCDRYFAIVHPLQFKRYVTSFRVNVGLFLMWAASFIAVGVPICINYGVHPQRKTCAFLFESASARTAYGWFIFMLRLIVPTTILLLTQAAIAFTLHRESKTFQADTGGTMHSKRSVHLVARDHVIKLMLIVIVAFVICWSPSQIFFFSVNIGFISFGYLYTPTHRICTILALCNSCLNPIIYIIRHSEFRSAVKNLFKDSGPVNSSGPLFEHKTESRERSSSVKLSTIG